MKKILATLGAWSCAISGAFAAEGPVPTGIPHLDHVFVIVMENHGYSQIIGNPNAPFTNYYARTANLATNYFAVAHPSLSNYLEIVGGSNFGVQSDNNPDWHNFYCVTNLASGAVNTDNPASPNVCPIAGVGADAAIPAIDTINETQGEPGTINIDGQKSYSAAKDTTGKTIADQLTAVGKTWKSYQENLPQEGADRVNISDGLFTDSTNFAAILPPMTPALAQSGVVALYAAKHNPFVYFQNIQEGWDANNSLDNVVGFDDANGLYADLASGNVPNYSLIAPNQCNDQHGRGNSDQSCAYDPISDGSQSGLNPALILRGDMTIRKLVASIKKSPVWNKGNNAIVIVWDENDYSLAPNTNQVPVIVDTNYAAGGAQSAVYYNHFSLLKSIEGGLGLPCLNHACDNDLPTMSDLFAGSGPKQGSQAVGLGIGIPPVPGATPAASAKLGRGLL
jgi:hypothetical protein